MAPRIIVSKEVVQNSTIPIHRLILECLQQHGEKTFMIEYENGKRFSFKQLLNDCLKLAAELKTLGLQPGDAYMVYGFNCYEFLLVFFAALIIGGTGIPMRGVDSEFEVLREIKQREVKFFFAAQELKKVANSVRNELKQVKEIILFDTFVNDEEIINIQSLLKSAKEPLNENDIFDPKNDQDTIAVILESSGTTGAAKGCMMGHYDLATAIQSRSLYNERALVEDVIRSGHSPFAHLSGTITYLFSIYNGMKVVALRKAPIEKLVDAIDRFKITDAIFTPSTLNLFNKFEGKIDLSSLKFIVVGGSRVSNKILKTFVEKFRVEDIRNGYTMTEITCVGLISQNLRETELKGDFAPIGKVGAGMQIKVIDVNNGRLLGENEQGELYIKGPIIFKGYHKNEKATKEFVDDEGWMHTGDMGFFDEHEEFFIVERTKDIIKQSGYSYSPADLEDILLEHEAVEEAAVVGIPLDVESEISHAFVVLKNKYRSGGITKKELKEFLNERITPIKALKGDIHFLNELPKT
ncbi:hypothetical protein B4U79_13600, partial [Dinothrombium tinctorium]